MIVPSIDLQGGAAVQLIGGKELEIHAGDPRPIMQRFAVTGEVAVIDLDKALGKGDNTRVIDDLLALGRCRVGGGIRDVATATAWLDKGASKIILGTAAKPEVLSRLPRERLIAALDARDGEVVVEGWQRGTGRGILERLHELAPHVGGFLVTFVEKEGRMQGTDMGRIREIVRAAGKAKVTFAGGVTTAAEIAEIDKLGADAQVGMALYSGKLDLADALVAPMVSDRPDGLWPTVVCDEQDRPGERLQRLLELLDRREVEVVGRLIEHQQVHPARLQQRERGPGALARRERRRRTAHVVLAQPELREQRAHLGGRPVGHLAGERVGERLVALERRASLVDLAHHHARPEPDHSRGRGSAPEEDDA